jgi:hypothetical protein
VFYDYALEILIIIAEKDGKTIEKLGERKINKNVKRKILTSKMSSLFLKGGPKVTLNL